MTRPLLGIMAIVSVYIGANGFISMDVLLAIPAIFLITAGSMTFNDYFDHELDQVAHPDRPVPAGIVQPREALYFSLALFALGVIFSFLINVWCFVLSIFGVAFLVLYETQFKQQGFLGNIVVAVLCSLAFPYGGVAVGRPWDATVFTAIAFFVILGREILMDTRDMSADVINRVTLPMRIGQQTAVRVGSIFAAVTIALTPVPLLLDILSWWSLILFIPADALLAYSIYRVLKDVKNVGWTSDMFRIAMVMILGAFLLGIIT